MDAEIEARLRALEETLRGWLAGALQHGLAGGLWLGEAAWPPAPGDLYLDGALRKSRALGCRVCRAAPFSAAGGAISWIDYDTELDDSDDGWDAAHPTRLAAGTAGWYLAGGCHALIPAPGVGWHAILVRRNGAQVLARCQHPVAAGCDACISVVTGMFWLEPGEYVELGAAHSFSSAVLAGAGEDEPERNAAWLARIA